MKTKSDRIHGCVGFAIGFESRVNIEDKLRRFDSGMSSGILFVRGFQNAIKVNCHQTVKDQRHISLHRYLIFHLQSTL